MMRRRRSKSQQLLTPSKPNKKLRIMLRKKRLKNLKLKFELKKNKRKWLKNKEKLKLKLLWKRKRNKKRRKQRKMLPLACKTIERPELISPQNPKR